MVSSVIQWLRVHWEDVLAVAGVVYIILLSIKNRYGDKAPKVVDVGLDVLSLLPRKGQAGALGPVNLPMVPSLGKKKAEGEDPPSRDNDLLGPPPAVLALMIGALTLSGCALSPAGKAHVALTTVASMCSACNSAVTAYDTRFQDELADEAERTGDTTTARAKLSEWRKKRAQARASLHVALSGLLAWQLVLQAHETGQKKDVDWGALLAGVAKIASQLLDGLTKLGIPNLPKLPDFGAMAPPEIKAWVVGMVAMTSDAIHAGRM